MRRLFHFTADDATHWDAIRTQGVILPLSQTDLPNPTYNTPYDKWLDDSVHLTETERLHSTDIGTFVGDKTAIRIEVAVPDAIRWAAFLNLHKFPTDYRVALSRDFADAPHWWVVERPIPWFEWVAVTNMRTGETYDLTARFKEVAS